ncbi:MAG: restriction endonuclease subunit S [Ruminiclostridium sp.]|nr:restriction endonuclease subunit S [Ruminiclostridium sp.]
MREMKDSGIEWIDCLPKEWDVYPLKTQFKFGKGLPITKADLVELGMPVVSYGQIHSKRNNRTHLSDELLRFVDSRYLETNAPSLGKKGDLFFADTSEDYDGIGNAVFLDTDSPVFAGYHTIIARPNNSKNGKYFAYLFTTDVWRSQLRSLASGIKVFSVTMSMLRKVSIILPPLPEQQRIADFLDRKCGELDAVLEKTRASIEEYKKLKQSVITEAVTKGVRSERPMKDSGIEWIPYIPTEISMSRVGLHYNIILGKMLCSNQPDDTYTLEPYYCAADVHFDGVASGERKMMWFSPTEKTQYRVQRGDLLVVEGGAGAGGCAIVTEADTAIYIQNSIMIVRAKNTQENRYLKYLVESLVKQGYVDLVCNKATIPHFTKDKLATVPFPVFSTEEQGEIADYLDTKCAEIDKLIAKKEQYITELESFKKSLIYKYVTGKKEVPV